MRSCTSGEAALIWRKILNGLVNLSLVLFAVSVIGWFSKKVGRMALTRTLPVEVATEQRVGSGYVSDSLVVLKGFKESPALAGHVGHIFGPLLQKCLAIA